MPYYLLYCFYRTYRWSERSGKAAPILGVVFVLLIAGYMNVAAIACALHIAIGGHDWLLAIALPKKASYMRVMTLCCFALYAALHKAKLHEHAFAKESMAIYERRGYTALRLYCYFAATLVAFVLLMIIVAPIKHGAH